MTLLHRAGEWDGITPETAGWRFLSFRVERLSGSDRGRTGGEETAIVLLAGRIRVEADGGSLQAAIRERLGSGAPHADGPPQP